MFEILRRVLNDIKVIKKFEPVNNKTKKNLFKILSIIFSNIFIFIKKNKFIYAIKRSR